MALSVGTDSAHDGPMELDRNGLEILDRDECLRLLGDARLGRVGLLVGTLPMVVPVNFILVGDQIVILTAAGAKLDAATNNVLVAFEVDAFDSMYHSGWSVMVTGRAHEVTDVDEVAALRREPLMRWAPHGDERFVVIDTDMVSGRRIVAGQSRTEVSA